MNKMDSNTIPEKEPKQPIADDEAQIHPTSSQHIFSDAPDGGLEAWLVAAGAFCVFFAGLGFVNSNGVFIEYYLSHQLSHRSADDVSWIASLSTFIQFASGLVGGPLFDRYGAWILRPSAFLYILAVMLTSLCREYWHFMLVQGVLLGIGMGGLMFPTIAAVSQYFDKNRAAALGLAIAGSSIGGVVLPIALSRMLNNTSLGFGWSLRIIGFILIPPLAFASVFIKSRLPPKKVAISIGAAFKVPTFNLLALAMFFMFLGVFTPLFFIPTYAVSQGMSPTLASYLVAIINAASTFGRIIPGIMADKLGPINVISAAGIITGIIVCVITQAKSNASLIVYSVFIGFFSGTVVSGATAALTRTVKDPRDLGTVMGVGMAVGSIAVLIGPPINGRLMDDYGYFELGLFSGLSCIVGGFVALSAKVTTTEGIRGRV